MYNLLRYSNIFLDIESNSISSTAKINLRFVLFINIFSESS